ncbi:hypothetical protein NX801_03385 [Streptomyces sp. LP05-1]|uniref:Secreted protein n=1 Tax=Streptomyces pyxinae TaxID=2970734 RepID=A0ABT2CBC6_9ACTN|nr:hypothetical protein [Streptomyces sp. LP05-1]MCS0634717.1 hypothetical protein [Streptomyces sp. LP05-1]
MRPPLLRPARRSRRAIRRLFLSAGLLATGALPLAGCAGAERSPREAAAAAVLSLCEDLGTLRADTGRLAGLDSRRSGVYDVRDLRQVVADDLEVLRTSARGNDRSGVRAVSEAYDGLHTAVDQLPHDITADRAARRLMPRLEALDRAIAGSQASVRC